MSAWRFLSRPVLAAVTLVASAATATAQAQQPAIEYTVSVPAPEQRWLQVDARFPSKAGTPLDVRMARSSPGRYAPHEFGKNVYLFEARGDGDTMLPVEQVAPAHWRITPSGSTVQVRYRLFADHVDGTYAAVDGTHAHLNAPATFAWAPSLADTPIRVRFTQPAGRNWRVSTQLFPTDDPLVFTAPNQAYLADSPIEFGDIVIHTVSVPARGRTPAQTIRVALHHQGTAEEARA